MFFGRTDAKAETPILWPPHAKNWLIGKDSDAGRDWGQEEKGTTEDEMAGWHHWLDGHEFEWTLGVGDGQGGLACCDSWGHKESDTTERLNWTEGTLSTFFTFYVFNRFLTGTRGSGFILSGCLKYSGMWTVRFLQKYTLKFISHCVVLCPSSLLPFPVSLSSFLPYLCFYFWICIYFLLILSFQPLRSLFSREFIVNSKGIGDTKSWKEELQMFL